MTPAVAILEGLLGQHYYYGVMGDADRALGQLALAQKVHANYQQRLAAHGQRVSLPPLADLQLEVLRQIEQGAHGFTPALRAHLQEIRRQRTSPPFA